MQPQRARLDQYLTPEEKIQVAKLNSRLRQLIADRNRQGIGFIMSDEFSFSNVPAYTEQQKTLQANSRDEMRHIMAEAWVIADKHKNEINSLIKEKSSYFGTWKSDLTGKVTDFLEDKFVFVGSRQIVKRMENREIVKYYSPVAFLLWDPTQRFVSDDILNSK
jgi:5'-3' exonuclease